jgi:hypothetical protein
MIKVNVKPLSVNQAYTGQRFATPALRSFRHELTLKLKPMKLPEPPYEISFVFGQSNAGADWDGAIKSAQDIIAKKYRFNDRLIRKGSAEIDLVKKGQEYIAFEIKHYEK